MQIACVICGGTRGEPWLMGCRDTYLSEPGQADYVRCEACGLVQQHPIPQALGCLYESYPVHAPKSRIHRMLRAALLRTAYFDASELPEGSALLDIGCGDGWYLESLGGLGLQRVGMELDSSHAARLAESLCLTIHGSWSSVVAAHPAGFDAVTMHFVLEHLPDPEQTLARVRQMLRPGGVLYVLVPNIYSWEARLFGRNWHGLDAPRHVIFPGDSNMRALAARVGFLVERSRHVAFPNTLAASLGVCCSGHHRDWLFKAWLPLALVVSRVAPQGSRAYHLRTC